MQHVPLKERLSSCCLVSRRMHAAATAATQDLQLDGWNLPGWPKLDKSVEGWLLQYGQHLTNLYLRGPGWPLLQSPCPNLQKLVLGQCTMQLGEIADGNPGVIKACNKLTCLVFQGRFIDAVEGSVVDSLSSLVHLQHLDVGTSRPLGGLSDATLPRLQHLTYLDFRLSADNLLQLGGLTKLQVLHLHVGDEAVRYSILPGFVLPASLRKLVLMWPIDAGITTDTFPAKLEAGMLSVIPTTLQELRIECLIEGPAEGPGSWLSRMARLQHLTKLVLLPIGILEWPPVGPAYSGLTASSNLVHLEMYDVGVPDGAWSYMFPAAHTLPHLTSLSLRRAHAAWVDGGVVPSWTAAETSSLISCCPSLSAVTRLCLQLGPHVSELHKLTALTRVHVTYELSGLGSFVESMRGLAAVTQLRQLELVHVSDTFNVDALLPLTSLTALDSLVFRWFPLADDDDDDGDCEHVDKWLELSNTEVGSAPDVWLQLLEHCAAEPDCHPAALRSLAQQLSEQKALTTALKQQALAQGQLTTAQQLQITGLQQQLSAQQQVAARQVAGLQQQLSAQQQAAAEQVLAQEQLTTAQQVQITALQQQLAAQQQAGKEQVAGLQRQLQELHASVQQLVQAQRQ